MRRLGSWLVRRLGPWPLLLYGDPMVVDRWRWIRPRLGPPGRLLDAGCGNGWLALNCARRGFEAVGVGFADADLARARERAVATGASATFVVADLRSLDQVAGLATFDVVTCTETIEHIRDDAAVVGSLARVLRPGGRLLMTVPNIDFTPIGGDIDLDEDEAGGHVRKGYSHAQLVALCTGAGLDVVEEAGVSGYFSQRATQLLRALRPLPYPIAWAVSSPLRLLAFVAPFPTRRRPHYSVCVVARRPR